jgi:hypothetical protein
MTYAPKMVNPTSISQTSITPIETSRRHPQSAILEKQAIAPYTLTRSWFYSRAYYQKQHCQCVTRNVSQRLHGGSQGDSLRLSKHTDKVETHPYLPVLLVSKDQAFSIFLLTEQFSGAFGAASRLIPMMKQKHVASPIQRMAR